MKVIVNLALRTWITHSCWIAKNGNCHSLSWHRLVNLVRKDIFFLDPSPHICCHLSPTWPSSRKWHFRSLVQWSSESLNRTKKHTSWKRFSINNMSCQQCLNCYTLLISVWKKSFLQKLQESKCHCGWKHNAPFLQAHRLWKEFVQFKLACTLCDVFHNIYVWKQYGSSW